MSTAPTTVTVTDAELAAFGFPVEVTDKCVGSKVIVVKGDRRPVAVARAWAAGHVTFAAAEAPPAGDTTWAAAHGCRFPVADPEMMAWAASTQMAGVR